MGWEKGRETGGPSPLTRIPRRVTVMTAACPETVTALRKVRGRNGALGQEGALTRCPWAVSPIEQVGRGDAG